MAKYIEAILPFFFSQMIINFWNCLSPQRTKSRNNTMWSKNQRLGVLASKFLGHELCLGNRIGLNDRGHEWISTLLPPFTSCVAWGKSRNLSEPWFPYLYNGIIRNTYLIRLLGWQIEAMYIKHSFNVSFSLLSLSFLKILVTKGK